MTQLINKSNEDVEFKRFKKIPRLFSDKVLITEKIDGTNCVVYISEDLKTVKAGSRSKWLTLDDDHFGFARWVDNNKEDLLKLGSGYFYGEWWGKGINREYGLDRRVFSLFNVNYWNKLKDKPSCCTVVPTLFTGSFSEFNTNFIFNYKESLAAKEQGIAFDRPEGFMIYFKKGNVMFKVPLNK